MAAYKKTKDPITGEVRTDAIIRASDGATVPFVDSNLDYQIYLDWLSDGNVPDEPDPT